MRFEDLFTPTPATFLVKRQLLRRWRKENKIKQKELAKLVGYSCPFICDIEMGRRTVSERLAKKLWELIEAKAIKDSEKNEGL